MKAVNRSVFLISLFFIMCCSPIPQENTIFTNDELAKIGNNISGMINTGRVRPGMWGTRGQAFGLHWDYEGKILPLYYNNKWKINDLTKDDKTFLYELSSREDDYLVELSEMNADTAEIEKFELSDFQLSYHYNHFLYSLTYQRYFLLKAINESEKMESLVKSLVAYNSKRRWNKALFSDAIYIDILTQQYLLTKDSVVLTLIDERLKDAKKKILDKEQPKYEVHEPWNETFVNTRLADACAIIHYATRDIKNSLSFNDYAVFKEFIDNYLNSNTPLDIANGIRTLSDFSCIDHLAPIKFVEYIIENYENENKKTKILNDLLYLFWKYQYDDGSFGFYRSSLVAIKSLDVINTILLKGNSYLEKTAKDCGVEAKNKASQWLKENKRIQIDRYPIVNVIGGMESELTKYELLSLMRLYEITNDKSILDAIQLACYTFVGEFWKEYAHAMNEASVNEYYGNRIGIEIGYEWAFPYSEIFSHAFKIFKDKPERLLYQRCMESMYENEYIALMEWFEKNNWTHIETEDDFWKVINAVRIVANIKSVVQVNTKINAAEAAKKLAGIISEKIDTFELTGNLEVFYGQIPTDDIPKDIEGYGYRYQVHKKMLDAVDGLNALNRNIKLNNKQIDKVVIKSVKFVHKRFNEMEKEINENPEYKNLKFCDVSNRVEATALLYKIAKNYKEFDYFTKPLGQKFKEEILAHRAYKHPVYHGRELIYGIGGPMLYALIAD